MYKYGNENDWNQYIEPFYAFNCVLLFLACDYYDNEKDIITKWSYQVAIWKLYA